jgi:hypothetical protein
MKFKNHFAYNVHDGLDCQCHNNTVYNHFKNHYHLSTFPIQISSLLFAFRKYKMFIVESMYIFIYCFLHISVRYGLEVKSTQNLAYIKNQ